MGKCKVKSIYYAVAINGVCLDVIYSTLKGACNAHNVPYGPATRGETFIKDERGFVVITECSVVRVSGRGGNHKGKSKSDDFS